MQSFATIDTSALSNLLASDDRAELLGATLLRRGTSLVVPADTLFELLGGEIELVHEKLLRLHRLVNTGVRPLCLICDTVLQWVNREHKRNGVLNNFPVLHKSGRWPGLMNIMESRDALEAFKAKIESDTEDLRRIRADVLKADRKFREEAKNRVPDSELRLWIDNISGHPKWQDVRIFGSLFPFFSRRKMKSALISRGRYTYLRVFLSALLLRALGNAINHFDDDDPYKFLHKLNSGNWYDLGCVVASGRTQMFVTDDLDQLNFALLMKKKGILEAEPIPSSVFQS